MPDPTSLGSRSAPWVEGCQPLIYKCLKGLNTKDKEDLFGAIFSAFAVSNRIKLWKATVRLSCERNKFWAVKHSRPWFCYLLLGGKGCAWKGVSSSTLICRTFSQGKWWRPWFLGYSELFWVILDKWRQIHYYPIFAMLSPEFAWQQTFSFIKKKNILWSLWFGRKDWEPALCITEPAMTAWDSESLKQVVKVVLSEVVYSTVCMISMQEISLVQILYCKFTLIYCTVAFPCGQTLLL